MGRSRARATEPLITAAGTGEALLKPALWRRQLAAESCYSERFQLASTVTL